MLGSIRKLAGYDAAFGALAIWTSWMLLTRSVGSTTMDGTQLTVLRYLIAGGLLLPIAFWRRSLFDPRMLVLGSLMGAPYMLLASRGLQLTPAAHAATFINSAMVVTSMVAAWFLLGRSVSRTKATGISAVIVGLGLIGSVVSLSVGHVYFALAGSMWAMYGVLLERWRIASLDAVIAVSAVSLIGFALPYAIANPTFLAGVPVQDIVVQGLFQGIVTSIGAHLLFARAVRILGATQVSIFVPLVPVLTAILGAAILGEQLGAHEWVGVTLVTAGMIVASRKLRPRKKQQARPRALVPFRIASAALH